MRRRKWRAGCCMLWCSGSSIADPLAPGSNCTLQAKRQLKDATAPHMLNWYSAGYTPIDYSEQRAPLTLQVQAELRMHQNPVDCKGKAFAVLQYQKGGIGALVHTATAALAWAYANNRILVFSNDYGSLLAHGEFCADNNNLECFFQPLSSCKPHSDSDVVPVIGSDHRSAVPAIWSNQLSEIGYTLNVLHWWRAQGAAWVMRLNAKTAEWLQTRRKLSLKQGYIPAIMPPNTFSIHVRHGEKQAGMTQYAWSDHLQAAHKAVQQRSVKDRDIFLSTEDPSVVEEAQQDLVWQVWYVPFARGEPIHEAVQKQAHTHHTQAHTHTSAGLKGLTHNYVCATCIFAGYLDVALAGEFILGFGSASLCRH